MIKHILKQILAQREKNIWIILELFMVFIILWYVVDFFSVMNIASRTPMGVEFKNVYRVILATKKADNPNYIAYEEKSEEPGKNFLRIINTLRSHPEIESVCFGESFYPYCGSSSLHGYKRDSLKTQTLIIRVIPEYFKMFNVRPDNGGNTEIFEHIIQQENAIIFSKKANKDLFGSVNGTGERIYLDGNDSIGIVLSGVTHEMKRHEYDRPLSLVILPFKESSLLGKSEDNIWSSTDICIKTKPGISPYDFLNRFQPEMKQKLAVGNFFLADIRSISKDRKVFMKSYGITTTLNYRIGIGIFFLINIFLGVLGTFWLRIEKRKSEIGLRMSVGSTKAQIMKFMLSESLCMLAIASVPALLVCINLAYLDIISTDYMDITVQRFLLNTLMTYILLIVVIALSIWYPAKRSATIQPAEALQYE